MTQEVKYSKSIVIRVCIIASLAGLLFGLDVAYVNGALGLIVKYFHLSTYDSGKVAGYLLAGAAFGALISGWVARNFGRKTTLVMAALIFTLVTILGATAHSFNVFLVARFIVGIAVGIASFAAPLYLSEIAPPKIRGAVIAMFQLMITAGIFLMFLSNAALIHFGSWRLMMIVLVIPSTIMLIGTLTLPSSPRWKVLVGKFDDAEKILLRIRNTKEEVDFELAEIKATLKHKTGGFGLLTKGYFLKVIALGIGLQILQQFTGINAFMYYSSRIFANAGFTNPQFATVIVGLVNLLTTLLAVKYVDKLGRKPILYFGLSIILITCATVGYIFNIESQGVLLSNFMQEILLAACLLFIFGFAVSLGPIVWIMCPEIFPLEGRDLGLTITTMANWIFNTIIGMYTLTWFKHFGMANVFWGFAGTALVGLFIIKFFTPETKNIPLEELEFNLKAGQSLRLLGHRSKIS